MSFLILTSQTGYFFHVLLSQNKIEDIYILSYSPLILRLRHWDDLLLYKPSQAYLGYGLFVFVAQFLHYFIFENFFILPGQWRVGFQNNVMLLTKIDSLFLITQWMDFNLIHSRFNFGILQQMLKMAFQKIAYANIFDFALFLHLNQSVPSFKPNLSVLWIVRLQSIHTRPVNQHQVNILAIQLRNDGFDSLPRFLRPLLFFTDFARNEQLLSFDPCFFNSLPYKFLVFIRAGSINIRIPSIDSCLNGFNPIFTFELITSKPDNGYFAASAQTNG